MIIYSPWSAMRVGSRKFWFAAKHTAPIVFQYLNDDSAYAIGTCYADNEIIAKMQWDTII